MSGVGAMRWTQIVAVALPLGCFGTARWVLDAGPAVAPGAQPEGPALAVAVPVSREPSAEQRRAMDWARAQSASRTLRSPMTRGVPVVPDPEPAPIAPPADPPAPPPDPAALFTVTSLLEAGAKQLATINGLTYAPGDELAPGYRLERVHGHRRVAVISCPDGSMVELRPRP
jgi:hypothetical protein